MKYRSSATNPQENFRHIDITLGSASTISLLGQLFERTAIPAIFAKYAPQKHHGQPRVDLLFFLLALPFIHAQRKYEGQGLKFFNRLPEL